MTTPDPPVELEPDNSPLAAAEGNLASVSDDEYFDALDHVPPARTDDGTEVNPREGVRDLRHLDPEERDRVRRELETDL